MSYASFNRTRFARSRSCNQANILRRIFCGLRLLIFCGRALGRRDRHDRLFSWCGFFGALPECFRSWGESAFWSGDADRDWFRLRSDVHELYSVSESVTQNVYSDGNAGSRFDGRHDAIITVVLLDHPRLLFRLRKDAREIVVEIRMIFSDQANQRFGRNFSNRNGAAAGKRMLRSDRHANAFVKQFLIAQVVQLTSLRGSNNYSV